MNADPLARHYKLLEHLVYGEALERCRTVLLPRLIPPPTRALFIGEGDGRFLQTFLRQFPQTEVDIIESSAAMIELATRRATSQRVRFRHADILTQDLGPANYDLVVTHFFIDVLTDAQLEALANRLRSAAAPKAYWLLSDFQLCRDNTLAHYLSRSTIAVMYAFFRLTTGLQASAIPDFPEIFTRAGLTRCTKTTMLGGFLTAELWQLP